MDLFHKFLDTARSQAAWFRLLARLGIHLHPRDAELVARFHRKRGSFEQIRAMLGEDSHIGYISHVKTRVAGEDRWRTQDDPGISLERWDSYRRFLQELEVFAVSHVGDTITMRVSTTGLSSKGFVYSPAHRVVVSSLEFYPMPPERHAHLVLEEPWHIYYGWES